MYNMSIPQVKAAQFAASAVGRATTNIKAGINPANRTGAMILLAVVVVIMIVFAYYLYNARKDTYNVGKQYSLSDDLNNRMNWRYVYGK